MNALEKASALVARSTNIEGYVNPVAYDATHPVYYGYWICKMCKQSFFAGGEAMHKNDCSLKGKIKGGFTYPDENLIYVLGPYDDGSWSPYKKEEIEKIKETAKSKLN